MLLWPLALAASEPEIWRCSTVRHPLVERHEARLALEADGRFTLRHTNTDPQAGSSLTMEGTWRREADTLLLTPAAGEIRRWRGDGHRFQHGEPVPYCEWREPLPAGERRLEMVGDRIYMRELGTHLGRGEMACDERRPEARACPS